MTEHVNVDVFPISKVHSSPSWLWVLVESPPSSPRATYQVQGECTRLYEQQLI